VAIEEVVKKIKRTAGGPNCGVHQMMGRENNSTSANAGICYKKHITTKLTLGGRRNKVEKVPIFIPRGEEKRHTAGSAQRRREGEEKIEKKVPAVLGKTKKRGSPATFVKG